MSAEARILLVDRVAAALGAKRFVDEDEAIALAEDAVTATLSFDGLMAIAERLLDERYPADVPLVCDRDSPDPGPRIAAALRDCLAASAPTEERP